MTMFYPRYYQNTQSMSQEDYEEFIQDDEAVVMKCYHEWVWSGNPNGQVWCKHCDVDHLPDLHGLLPDLSKRPLY